jgi:two-component system NtrC family sensor kinase
MECSQYRNVFRVIGDAFNAPITAEEMLRLAAKALVDEFGLKGCHFRLLSRDQKILEGVASYGLSEEFLNKGPVDAEKSVAEALEGNVVMVADCSTDPRIQYQQEFAKEGIVSLLTIPLATRGQVIGVMRLSTAQPRQFTSDEIESFQVAALFCTSVVSRAMFHQILGHVSDTVQSSLDLEDVLNSIVTVVTEDLRAKGCTIRLLDAKAQHLELRAAYGLSPRYLEKASALPGKGVWKAIEGECVPIVDVRNDPLIAHPEEAVREQISSMLFAPLMIRERAIGVLSIYTHHQYVFSTDEMRLIQAIGEQCALAIRNAQMYAAIKRRYEVVVDEFHQWFEHYCTFPSHTDS